MTNEFLKDFPSLKGHCSFDEDVDYDCGDNVIDIEIVQENCLDKKRVLEAMKKLKKKFSVEEFYIFEELKRLLKYQE